MNSELTLLRHTLATLAYRAARAIEGAPKSFAAFDGAGRRPDQILAHMGDLFDWALSMANGHSRWHVSTPLPWSQEVERFFATLSAFDDRILAAEPFQAPVERLLQGPIADALTHVGQLAMMRRLAACPMRGENYYVAAIEPGQINSSQPEPVQPFR